MPDEAIGEYFGALITGAPALDDARLDVHNPQFVGRRTKIEVLFESTIEARCGRREELHGEYQDRLRTPLATLNGESATD